MDIELLRKIFQRVQSCMSSLVEGSGHVSSYSLRPDTFIIKKSEAIDNNCTKYHFQAGAYLASEFTAAGDDNGPTEPEIIQGTIVLDENCELVRDDDGKVLLEPWTCVQPQTLGTVLTHKDKTKHLLESKLKRAEELLLMIIEQGSFSREEKVSTIIEQIQARIIDVKSGTQDASEYVELEDIYVNLIVGIMDQDMLAPDDEVGLLIGSIQNRLQHFDSYFDKLQKNKLDGPFTG